MMPTADLVRHFHQRLVLIHLETRNHVRTDHCVFLHDLTLLRCQRTRFIQNLLVNSDLSNVMQGRCRADQHPIRPGQVIFVRLLDKLFQNHRRQCINIEHMRATLAISKFHDLAQDADQHPAILLFLKNLIRHQCHQPSLFRIQFDRIQHTPVYNLHVERALDIIRNAPLIRPLHGLARIFARNHDNRDIPDQVVAVHVFQNPEAVHPWHDDIEKDQGNLRLIAIQHVETRLAIFRLQNLEFAFQHF